jgi:hypothetical protein
MHACGATPKGRVLGWRVPNYYKSTKVQCSADTSSFFVLTLTLTSLLVIIIMSGKNATVKTGDVLKIPALSEDEKTKQTVSVEWSQDNKNCKEDYYLVKATNQSRGE